MIIPGFPIPAINVGGPNVTFGTVDVFVGKGQGIYGFDSSGLESISNNSLIAVDGNLAVIDKIYSNDTNNIITLLFNSNEEANAALDAINAQFSFIIGGTGNLVSQVSDFSISTNSLVLDAPAVQGAVWDSGDVGNSEIVGWS